MYICMHAWMDGWMCVCVLQPYHADRCWLFLILAMLLIYLRDSFRGVGGSGAEPPFTSKLGVAEQVCVPATLHFKSCRKLLYAVVLIDMCTVYRFFAKWWKSASGYRCDRTNFG